MQASIYGMIVGFLNLDKEGFNVKKLIQDTLW